MSLQPGINPLDRRILPTRFRTMEYVPERDKSEIQLLRGSSVYGPGPGEMDRYQHRSFPSAEEMQKRMQGGIPNMGGFDPSSLMSAPKLRQDATMNQANMVSSPYFEANEKAAEKTNPMNAASQEPGRSFLMKYIGK